MRLLLLAIAIVSLATPIVPAQGAASIEATLTIDVGADRAEAMALRFEGLRRLTQYNGICLPEGATESRVHDDLGNVPYQASDEDGRRVITFTARSETLTIDMARAGPGTEHHPLYAASVNFCVPADSHVTVIVRVPAEHDLFFLTDGGEIAADGRSGSTSSDGPTHVFYSYEAPLANAPIVAFNDGAFRAYVAPDKADAARKVVSLATRPYQAALDEAGLPRPFDTLRVIFVEETPFSWEAGHYNGQGFVSVKDTTLVDDATLGFPYAGVKVLVHEAFHAASFPYGKGPVEDHIAWWLEGSARRSERHVDAAMPNATIHCTKSGTEVRCWSFDDRIARSELDAGYSSSFTFDPAWEPSLPQPEDTRRFYYGYSEYVVGAWIEQNGKASYQKTWDDITAAFATGAGCPCEEGWLEGLLDEEDLFRPWDEVRTSNAEGFDARVKPFVKDEAALQDALNANAIPGLGMPAPWWLAIVALALGVVLRARRPRR